MLEIFQHVDDTDSPNPPASPTTSSGRPIDPLPIYRIVLEPGSLLITDERAYNSTLHGIPPRESDDLAALPVDGRGRIANVSALRDPMVLAALRGEAPTLAPPPAADTPETDTSETPVIDTRLPALPGVLPRGTRISLTFRAVEKVSNALSLLYKPNDPRKRSAPLPEVARLEKSIAEIERRKGAAHGAVDDGSDGDSSGEGDAL